MLATYPYQNRTFTFNPAAPLDISLPLAPGESFRVIRQLTLDVTGAGR